MTGLRLCEVPDGWRILAALRARARAGYVNRGYGLVADFLTDGDRCGPHTFRTERQWDVLRAIAFQQKTHEQLEALNEARLATIRKVNQERGRKKAANNYLDQQMKKYTLLAGAVAIGYLVGTVAIALAEDTYVTPAQVAALDARLEQIERDNRAAASQQQADEFNRQMEAERDAFRESQNGGCYAWQLGSC